MTQNLYRIILVVWTMIAFHSPSAVSEPEASSTRSFSAKFVPPAGKLRMFMGQDSETISKYRSDLPKDSLEGVTLYTAVFNTEDKSYFAGVYEPANWGAGPIDFNKTLQHNPGAALAIGLGFSGLPETQEEVGYQIADGKHDKELLRFAKHLKAMSPRPVFLRIGWEFDGFWFGYRPDSYKKAFRHIHSLLQQAEANNVVTVWHSAAWPEPNVAGDLAPMYDLRKPEMLNSWYPGDDVVDWVAISVFYRSLTHQWDYTPPNTPEAAQASVLNFARKHNKPVLIAEAAPHGYRIGQLSLSTINKNQPIKTSAEKIWEQWYQPFFNFIYENKDIIRAVAYINTHWDDQPMWQCALGTKAGDSSCKQGNWGDSRVQANGLIKERWLNQVLNSDLWLQSNPELLSQQTE